DPTRFRMSWLDRNERLNRPFGPPEYREATAGIEVAAMVYMEVDIDAPYKLLEAQWVDALAGEEPRLQGIVASAPVEYGEQVRAFLEALVAIGPRVKGIRRITQSEPDPDFCLQPRFIRGVQLLPEFGLSFDICINHRQLASTIKLVEQCPDTSFMLDHIAKPDIKGGQLDPWREQMATMARFPHVTCKISGVVTEADHQRWTVDEIRPYVEHALEVFGEDRVAYGGDWPVVLNAAPYRRWVEALDTITAGLTAEAKTKLWAENARRFYRLPSA
ncbi:MAG TPA: amidohydrolase family protein, partial [Chloroflexota bacterium]|nr:amidohydrolase family protein [Chloroflexota bacterium]